MRIVPALALLCCLTFSARAEDAPRPATAGGQPAAHADNAVPAPDEAPNPDDTICKTIKTPGSRAVATKVCLTRREWAAEARDNPNAAPKMERAGPSTGG